MSEDIPRKPHSRYYEDSDDMVERIRRLKEAFERKIHSFQGADWPYYAKRVIVGKKKNDEAPIAVAQPGTVESDLGVVQIPTPEAPIPVSPGNSSREDAEGGVSSSDQTSNWWEARRREHKATSARRGDKKLSPNGGAE